jgi:hypothetical protein
MRLQHTGTRPAVASEGSRVCSSRSSWEFMLQGSEDKASQTSPAHVPHPPGESFDALQLFPASSNTNEYLDSGVAAARQLPLARTRELEIS